MAPFLQDERVLQKWRKSSKIYISLSQAGVETGVNFGKNHLKKALRVLTNDSPKSPLYRLIVVMGVDIQGNADIGVPHQILQALNINPGLLHVGAEGVAENMGRHRRHVIAMNLPILLLHLTHVVFQVHCHFRLLVLVQKQKAAASVNASRL